MELTTKEANAYLVGGQEKKRKRKKLQKLQTEIYIHAYNEKYNQKFLLWSKCHGALCKLIPIIINSIS